MSEESSKCPSCGREIRLTAEKTFQNHKRKAGKKGKKGPLCNASGRNVSSLSDTDGNINSGNTESCQYCGAVGEFGRRNSDGPICDKCAQSTMLDTILEVMDSQGMVSDEVRTRADILRKIIGGE